MEDLPCFCDICRDLDLEGIDTCEGALSADPVVEENPVPLAIAVPVEIKKMGFDHRMVGSESGFGSDIGGPIVIVSADLGPGRIDPGGRNKTVVGGDQVQGGEAEQLAAFFPR